MVHVTCRSYYAHISFFLKIDSSAADIADGDSGAHVWLTLFITRLSSFDKLRTDPPRAGGEEWFPAPAFARAGFARE